MKYLQAFALSTLMVFAPIKTALATALVLIIADMITGIWAAYKRREKISSADLRRSVSKLAIYELTLCFSYLAEHYMMSDQLPALKIVSGMIGLVELKSILENLNSISGNDLLKSIISKLGSTNQSEEGK